MKNYLKINNQYLIPFKERTSFYDKYKEVYKVDNKKFDAMEAEVEMVTLEVLGTQDVLKVLKETKNNKSYACQILLDNSFKIIDNNIYNSRV